MTPEEEAKLAAIRERNKQPWRIVDSRYGEIVFLLGLVDRLREAAVKERRFGGLLHQR
jgi:hypothetical protein